MDGAVSRLDHQLAVAVDQAGFAVHVDLREAEPVAADEAIARRYDFVSVLVDETIEAAGADGGATVGKHADPVVARRHSNGPVAPHCATKAAGKAAHRERECQRLVGTGPVTEGEAVTCEVRFEDGLAGRRQLDCTIVCPHRRSERKDDEDRSNQAMHVLISAGSAR